MTKKVVIEMSAVEANELQFGLSDMLSWMAGFRAGREGTEYGAPYMCTEEGRRLNLKLKEAILEAESK